MLIDKEKHRVKQGRTRTAGDEKRRNKRSK